MLKNILTDEIVKFLRVINAILNIFYNLLAYKLLSSSADLKPIILGRVMRSCDHQNLIIRVVPNGSIVCELKTAK